MAMVEYFANTPTCSLGDLSSSLGGTVADVLAGDDCTFSNIASSVKGVEGDEIARTFSDALGCGSSALGSSFACVAYAAAYVASGAALLGLGRWLGCCGLRLGILPKDTLATYGEG
jgi:hypothetical protein